MCLLVGGTSVNICLKVADNWTVVITNQECSMVIHSVASVSVSCTLKF